MLNNYESRALTPRLEGVPLPFSRTLGGKVTVPRLGIPHDVY